MTSHTHTPVPSSDTPPYLLPVTEEEKNIRNIEDILEVITLLACLAVMCNTIIMSLKSVVTTKLTQQLFTINK
jgi:hypothetical protein